MEDLDDDEYGYATNSDVHRLIKKNTTWKEAFVDAHGFLPYQKDSHSSMISKFFFSPREDYGMLSIDNIRLEMSNASAEVQQDLSKHITACLLPELKRNSRIADLFNLFSCKNKFVRNLCINELTDIMMDADQGKFSKNEMMMLYETGTIQLFTVISETKKTSPLFQPLIQLGIIFNCFIYLRAIQAVDDWVPFIQKVFSAIPSKKRVMERDDPDVIIFAKMTLCISDLEEVNLDESLLMGEDVDDFFPSFSREHSNIYIEGLAALYHTGNLVLRQQSKFNSGVQKLVNLSSYMDGCNDERMMKWYHRLLDLFIVNILQREHSDIKLEILEKGEDKLFSSLNRECLFPESFSTSHCLLFHHNERIQSKYREIAERRGIVNSKRVTEDHIQTLLNKCGLAFDKSSPDSPPNIGFERKQCKFCNVDASLTCIFEVVPDEPSDMDKYDSDVDDYTATKFNTRKSSIILERLENEMEVLKEIESKDMHRNVARLLAFNQSLPKFYIKERLPGDNLQRRLLEARDKEKIIPIADLIGIIVQAVQAIIYVHSCGCLVRDITTASFGCTMTENGYFLKLKNFEMAVKPSDFPSGGIVCGLIDLDFNGVCTRWAAPESLLEGRYSIYSDVWSVNILADEILNYAAWPYSDISDAELDDMIINIVFTHLKPQGFNRPRRVQGLILEGLASEPDQRLKLEALRERLLEISDNVSGGGSYSTYDSYSGVEGTHAKVYDIPPLTERQIKANSVFERGIPPSIQRYRMLDEDPMTVFASEATEHNERLRGQSGIPLAEISSDEYYKIESGDKINKMKVMEKVSEDFLKFTYNRLKEIDRRKICVEPWPPSTSVSEDGSKQIHYKFPRSTHLLDITLHKYHGDTIGPYIELLYELANHIDSFHSAGWIFRCLRAKNVWILATKEREQTIVVPKFGKYRVIASSEFDIHLEQIKVERLEETDGIQWLPIEAIKAGLYSKESDVYAFGMITWEVMSAFGQEGVVYDKDEDRELQCIPFNYQQSEKILQHLIDGYIPEKHVKCPDWFYREVTRPCLLHQKIDRPSMKTILQILETRLGKSLPKQILYLPSLPPPDQPSQSNETTTDGGDDDGYEDTEPSTDLSHSNIKESKRTEKEGNSPMFLPPQTGRPLPEKPCQSNQIFKDGEMHEDDPGYEDFEIGTIYSQSCIEESKRTEKDGNSPMVPPPQTRRSQIDEPYSNQISKEREMHEDDNGYEDAEIGTELSQFYIEESNGAEKDISPIFPPPRDEPSQSNQTPKDVQMYKDDDDDDEDDDKEEEDTEISNNISPSCREEYKRTEKNGNPPLFPTNQMRRPPLPPVSYYNTKESESLDEVKCNLSPQPAPPPKPKQVKGKDAEDRMGLGNKGRDADKNVTKGDNDENVPPVPRRPPPLPDIDDSIPPVKRSLPPPPPRPKPKDVKGKDAEERLSPEDKGRDADKNLIKGDIDESIPPVLRRPPPVPYTENQKDSAETTDEKSCKTLPLPQIPQSEDSESVNVEEQSAKIVRSKTKIHQSKKYQNVKEQKSLQFNQAKFRPLPPTPEGTKNAFDSDYENKTSAQNSGDTEKGFDVDSSSKSCDAHHISEGLGDAERGSDFYGEMIAMKTKHHISEGLEDTERSSDFYGKLPVMKMKSKVLPKPGSKNISQLMTYVSREEISEQVRKFEEVKRKKCETAKQSNPIYVNEMETDSKPALPPRKPLNK